MKTTGNLYLYDKGFTIIEVMIAIGLGAIVLMGMLAMANQGMKMQKYLTQKYDVLDFGAMVRLNVGQANFCPCNFPTALNLSLPTIAISTLNTVPANACTPTSGVLISTVAPNNILPGQSASLKVTQIQMENIHLISVLSPTSNLYSFDLRIEFDPASMTYAIKPLVMSGFTATTSATGSGTENITACGVSSVTIGSSSTSTGGINDTCPPGQSVVGISNNTIQCASNMDYTLQSACSAFGGSYDPITGQCLGLPTSSGTAAVGSKCGLCDHHAASQESHPCQGIDLCQSGATCPAGYNLMQDIHAASYTKWCVKY